MNSKEDILVPIWAATNMKAMARVVREKESRQTEDAYTLLNGGSHFVPPPWKHPFYGLKTSLGGKAAGAYQALGTTWREEDIRWHFNGLYDPVNQDLFFVARCIYRHAVDAILRGSFSLAVTLLRNEWSSLPGASESHSAWTVERALVVFHQYGGTP